MKLQTKSRLVSEALFNFYKRKNIDTITEWGIKNKIDQEITLLNKILKLKSKTRSELNIQYENNFKRKLGEIFSIERIRQGPNVGPDLMELHELSEIEPYIDVENTSYDGEIPGN